MSHSNLVYQPKSYNNQGTSQSHNNQTNFQHSQHEKNNLQQTQNLHPQITTPLPQPSNDFLPGTASLVEEVDKRLLVVLRDGRKLVGTLRSFDQFANIVLEDTVERIYLDDNITFGEKRIGLFLVRGENVVLLGELDVEKDEKLSNSKLKKIPFEEAKKKYKTEQEQKEEQANVKRKALAERGIMLDPFSMTTDNLYFE